MNKISLLCGLLVVCGFIGCNPQNNDPGKKETSMPTRGIMEVQEAHTKMLMAIQGVVGVYIGAKDDGTPCIRVMVKKRTNETDVKIPRELEGYPVEVEVTGTIEPFDTAHTQ